MTAKKETTMMKLYSVTTIVTNYHGCKNVAFKWFRCDPPPEPRPYAELIADYRLGEPYNSEGAIDEAFTEAEAEALKTYLDANYGDAGTTAVARMKLPMANNVMGWGEMAVGGVMTIHGDGSYSYAAGDDFYMLDKDANYSLPFKACGYFDLEGCERAEGEPHIASDDKPEKEPRPEPLVVKLKPSKRPHPLAVPCVRRPDRESPDPRRVG